ncbi:MAG: universal stress protein [Thermoplasmatota archaeon]
MATSRTILAAVDFSVGSRRAWGAAQALAKDMHAKLRLVHVSPEAKKPIVERPPDAALPRGRGARAAMAQTEEAMALSSEWADEARSSGLDVEVEVLGGKPAKAILAEAERSRADLIAMGTQGRTGFQKLLMGSVAQEIAAKSRIPVLVTPARMKDPSSAKGKGSLLVGVDFSPESAAAFGYAIALARDLGASLHLVHSIQVPFLTAPYPEAAMAYSPEIMAHDEEDAAIELTKWAERARKAGVAVAPAIYVGDPATALLSAAHAARATAIVVATRGSSGFRGFALGSVARNLVRISDRPLVVVPATWSARSTRKTRAP